MMSDYCQSIPILLKETLQAANTIKGCDNFYILIDEYLGVSLEDIQFDLTQNHWSENLNLVNCSTCVSGEAGRRH